MDGKLAESAIYTVIIILYRVKKSKKIHLLLSRVGFYNFGISERKYKPPITNEKSGESILRFFETFFH